MDKPDGLTEVPAGRVRDFLDPLLVSKMWGVGKVTEEGLARLGVRTFRDLRRMPVEVLERQFGRSGRKMHELARGIDDREVVPDHGAKSVGHEETFSEDITDLGVAKRELLALANKVARRMRRHCVRGRTVTLKVKYADFVLVTRSMTLPEPTDDASVIYSSVCWLLGKTEVGRRRVRLLGVSLSHLVGEVGGQLSLFGEAGVTKRRELVSAMDRICERFGDGAIGPGTLVKK
jgi:DNA polymerase-4